ncbi:MAG: hypothetical protein KGJ23_07575 [Euryarchaeota archaeon]|nr:hypothetical protein [Euryarchaeota archaeon]MDE2044207.1 hypothetical protein [Thermoplasmata archaeon]
MTSLPWECGIALLLVLGGVIPFSTGLPMAVGPVPTATGTDHTLIAAQDSLSRGEGPAQGHPFQCTSTGALSLGCAESSFTPRVQSSAVGWQRLCSIDVCPPPGRGGAGMTYDPITGYVVLFGGIKNLTTASGTTYNDTWVFQNGNWTQLHIAGPTPRLGQYMAYDYVDHYVVMFGGGPYLTLDSTLYFHDTWTFQNGTWTQLDLSVYPSARGLGGMVWDPADGYLLMVGGMTSPTDVHSDTWTFVNGQWNNRTASIVNRPPPLLAPGVAYDAATGYVLVFGGASPAPGLQFGADQDQTWSYAHGIWTNLTPSVHGAIPDGRILASMAYDPVDGYVLLFGGWNTTTGALFGDTWIFVNGAWTLLFLSPSPAAAIIGASLISTVPTAGLLLFGGIVGTYTSYHSTNATWSYGPAPYLRATPFVVSIVTGPSTCSVEFNGSVRSSGSSANVLPGAYGTAALPCSGYTFSGWFTGGGVTVASGTGPAMTLDVTGNGSLTAYYEPSDPGATVYRVDPATLGTTLAVIVIVVLVVLWARRIRPARPRPPPLTPEGGEPSPSVPA